ncbi:protein kinase domain-containing protein [Cyanobacterium sp. IPPAS B-1200]|uniref:protein kinase domain-containing protein n=1 Tax=Cyanobacterium sp. IPPAS B-1200 TaxID=1562720 RepID=UPI00085287F0|nr:protein kinase [Cyanobacterium sp. IPPAS B-1200]OEJ79684.1 serine/threonine protein kinase [Cyanobacterium sp. IPPAS B-1200]
MAEIINGRYEIINTLGKGGFGETFIAKDTQMPSAKLVVIKKLKPLDSQNTNLELVQNLFAKEAQVLEQLGQNCTQIPTLYAYLIEDGEFYLIQEHIEGESLADIGIINFARCEAILSSLLNTLKYIHSQNIIHRDIKPENIIIRKSDGLPVLIDFGAVKETMGAMTRSNGSTVSSVVVGTRGFMAPEQSAGRTLFSSDLYALGLTMIYGLTGKYPIEFANNPLTGELDWDSSLPNIPAPLKTTLQKAIKMEVGQRYSTAQDMYLALHQSQPSSILENPNKHPIELHTISNDPTIAVFPSGQNYSQGNPPQPVSGANYSQGYYQPSNQGNSNNNNIIVILLTAILVALGVSGGFFAMEQMRENQAKLDRIEQEKAETEQKLIEEQKRREDEEVRRLDSERLASEANDARLRAEEDKRRAEQEARNRVIPVNNQPTSINNPDVNTVDISEATVYIHYQSNESSARSLQDYLFSRGVNIADDIDQINGIRENDIRYSNSSALPLARAVKNEIESFYRSRGINKNLEMIDLSARGFQTPSNQMEIWINE